MAEEYLYRCLECGEEIVEKRVDLTECPYCAHTLSEPIKLEGDVSFVGRGSGRTPCLTDLV